MKKIENTALQMIAEASRCPDYGPDMVKSLMPCGTAKRLMQIYETGPEIVGKIAGGQLPADGRD